jgi:S1-C subfamily serine protease
MVTEAMGGTVKSEGGKVKIESPKTDLEKVVADCKDSCVMIYVYKDNKIVAQGSGFYYNGYVITAKHVTDLGTGYNVFTDDSISGASAFKVDVKTDLDVSVLKVDGLSIPSVKLGDSDKMTEGEKIVAITSPKNYQNTIDECLYSGKVYTNHMNFMNISESELDAGSSGGAIFNDNSEIVGMNVAGTEYTNRAIFINDIKPIIKSLK